MLPKDYLKSEEGLSARRLIFDNIGRDDNLTQGQKNHYLKTLFELTGLYSRTHKRMIIDKKDKHYQTKQLQECLKMIERI